MIMKSMLWWQSSLHWLGEDKKIGKTKGGMMTGWGGGIFWYSSIVLYGIPMVYMPYGYCVSTIKVMVCIVVCWGLVINCAGPALSPNMEGLGVATLITSDNITAQTAQQFDRLQCACACACACACVCACVFVLMQRNKVNNVCDPMYNIYVDIKEKCMNWGCVETLKTLKWMFAEAATVCFTWSSNCCPFLFDLSVPCQLLPAGPARHIGC